MIIKFTKSVGFKASIETGSNRTVWACFSFWHRAAPQSKTLRCHDFSLPLNVRAVGTLLGLVG
jgi:hypothetical protein